MLFRSRQKVRLTSIHLSRLYASTYCSKALLYCPLLYNLFPFSLNSLNDITVFGKGATFLDFVTINTARVLFEVLLVGEGEVRRKQVLIFYTHFLLFIFLFVFHYWQFG